jgi:cytochrome d ubiquinol oxidase subunit II
VALGNVVRGVPLDASGYFDLPLFTSFQTTNPVGILDWYTVLVGVFALVAITAHGALFLAWKTDGPVHDRSVALSATLWSAVAVLWVVVGIATDTVNPDVWAALPHRPLGLIFTALALGGLFLAFYGQKQQRYLRAFLGSSAFILGLLAATAACVFPVMLRSSLDRTLDLTALNSTVAPRGLATGLKWWVLGFPIAIGYIVMLFRIHRGKVSAAGEGEGY